jgi:hypothetical protein
MERIFPQKLRIEKRRLSENVLGEISVVAIHTKRNPVGEIW